MTCESKAKHIDTSDFATLYTNIPHNSLKSNLHMLIEEAFKVRGAKYLLVNRHGTAYWSLETGSDISIDKYTLIEMLEYLIDNIFIMVGNRMFRQHIGIPMGTDCAPLLANLYLFFYEYRYIKGLMKDSFETAKMFKNTMRYIDDLLVLNNPGFSSKISQIYPPELVLKCTTVSPVCTSYLDIDISICNNRFFTTVFDKRDNFNFDIVNFPFLCSNIPTSPAYGVYISQLVRISRICEKYSDFVQRHHILTSRLIRQGFLYSKLCRAFKCFSRKYSHLLGKYNVSIRSHIHDGICLPLCAVRALTKHITCRHVSVRHVS